MKDKVVCTFTSEATESLDEVAAKAQEFIDTLPAAVEYVVSIEVNVRDYVQVEAALLQQQAPAGMNGKRSKRKKRGGSKSPSKKRDPIQSTAVSV